MADRTVPIGNLGESDAPLTYTVPPSFSFTLMGVRASFDGAGAAGAFLPCVQLISDSGQMMAQTIGSAVAAGGSADVTFAPFLGGLAGSTPAGSGIQFDTFPQSGDWLYVQTTDGTGAPSGIPLHFYDSSAAAVGISLQSDNGEIDITAFGNQLDLSSFGVLSLTSSVSMVMDVGAFLRMSVIDDLRIDVGNGMSLALNAASTALTVLNHLGAPIFEVREDGSLHGETGKSLVFDL
jgi:hypothetical protein